MKKLLLSILFIFIAISFITLFRNPLIYDDAALYALAAKNAVIHNHWLAQFVTPGDLSSFLDKPPLGIWLLAWIPGIAGVNELTIHIPNVLYYCVLLFLLYFGVSRLSSRETALYSTLIASTSLGLVVYSRAPKLDILLPLFMLAGHLALYAYIKKEKPVYLYIFSAALAGGFLVKSGFGVLLTGLTLLFLLIFSDEARRKIFRALLSPHSIFNILLFAASVGGVLWAQSFALKDQWVPYLISITIKSKYNTSYLGFGFYISIAQFLLIILFPWTPLWLSSLKVSKLRKINSKLTLFDLCNIWLWSNILFLLFAYRQSDLRTFTVLVPPMAILAANELLKPRKLAVFFQVFFLILFTVILAALLINPVNPQGFSLKSAILPIFFFVVSLFALTIYFWKPSNPKLVISYLLICFSYSLLFFNTKPIADDFNPDAGWPKIIAEQKNRGYQFFIYRPPDRKLVYSPDLFYVDFMAGPADRYYWDGQELKHDVQKGKALILSDSRSWKKLNLERGKILAEDDYSRLILYESF
jgi:4-amino-4-deoxy-L-arabinose transferase-like glycosyltransferase